MIILIGPLAIISHWLIRPQLRPLSKSFRYNPSCGRGRLAVRTLRCGRKNPGSIPGHGTAIFCRSYSEKITKLQRRRHALYATVTTIRSVSSEILFSSIFFFIFVYLTHKQSIQFNTISLYDESRIL